MFRFVLSTLLTLLFVASFVTYLILGSLVSYVDDSEHILESAAEFGMRDELVALTVKVIGDDVRADPQLASIGEAELTAIISSVITEEWVRQTIRTSHKGLKKALRGFEEEASLDFRETKEALRAAASSLEERALENCEEALGAASCGDQNLARQKARRYQERATGAIDALPERIDLGARLSSRDRKRAKKLTDGLRTVETLKAVSLGLCLALLIALGLLNARRLQSLLISVGLALGLGSICYFIAVAATRGEGRQALERALAEHRTGPIASFTSRFSAQVLDDALGTSMTLALSMGVTGLLLTVAGLLLWRRASEA